MSRDMTPKGYAVNKSFEGRALKSYKDVVGVWTIGYGNTNYDAFAVEYLKRKIGPGITITESEAEYLLHESMRRKYLPQVERVMPGCSDGAFDAGGSFHYNTGAISRASWVKKFMASLPYRDALMSWNKGGGRVLAGLTRRRAREYAMVHDNDYGPEGRNAPPVLHNGRVVPGAPATVPADHPDHPLAGTPGMLRKGDELPEVKDLQDQLIALGFKVVATGKFDDATDKAVRSFQQAHPQLGLDGVVGPATRKALQREIDAKRKLKTSTATTTTSGGGAVITDQLSGGGLPGWSYVVIGLIIVGVACYYGWKYRDEIRGMFTRKPVADAPPPPPAVVAPVPEPTPAPAEPAAAPVPEPEPAVVQ